jgi:hypothetical protein
LKKKTKTKKIIYHKYRYDMFQSKEPPPEIFTLVKRIKLNARSKLENKRCSIIEDSCAHGQMHCRVTGSLNFEK